MEKKISFLMVCLLIVISVFPMGCGYVEREEDIEGKDWRTYRAFVYLEWNTPEGKKDLLAAGYEQEGVVILAPDEEAYNPFPDCPLEGGIHDISTVMDNIYMKDYNNDKYDDLGVEDMIDGRRVSEVFVFNPDTESFDYSDEYSTVGVD
ncbi:MAG: hypothetical protein IJS35_05215 [Firmicutes bacterium]|nr:hypothetical protein [Bacillota bacterium]